MSERCVKCGAESGNSETCSPCAVKAERAAVVAWLLKERAWWLDHKLNPAECDPGGLAACIERGEHLSASTG